MGQQPELEALTASSASTSPCPRTRTRARKKASQRPRWRWTGPRTLLRLAAARRGARSYGTFSSSSGAGASSLCRTLPSTPPPPAPSSPSTLQTHFATSLAGPSRLCGCDSPHRWCPALLRLHPPLALPRRLPHPTWPRRWPQPPQPRRSAPSTLGLASSFPVEQQQARASEGGSWFGWNFCSLFFSLCFVCRLFW